MGWYVVHMTLLHRAAPMDVTRRHQPHRDVAVRERLAHGSVRLQPTDLKLVKIIMIKIILRCLISGGVLHHFVPLPDLLRFGYDRGSSSDQGEVQHGHFKPGW